MESVIETIREKINSLNGEKKRYNKPNNYCKDSLRQIDNDIKEHDQALEIIKYY